MYIETLKGMDLPPLFSVEPILSYSFGMEKLMAINNDTIKRIAEYYEHFDESERLTDPLDQLEYVRSQEMIRRHLSSPPAVVLDIGGAAGIYSCWLAQEGYEVHLVDPIPSLVECFSLWAYQDLPRP